MIQFTYGNDYDKENLMRIPLFSQRFKMRCFWWWFNFEVAPLTQQRKNAFVTSRLWMVIKQMMSDKFVIDW